MFVARSARRRLAVLVALVAALTALLSPQAASAATPTSVWIGTSSALLNYGSAATISVRAYDSAGSDQTARRVKLAYRIVGQTTWNDVTLTDTDANGRTSYSFTPRRGVDVKVWVAPTVTQTSASSKIVRVGVRPGISSIQPPSSAFAVKGHGFTSSGKVHADLKGRSVQLQIASGSTWKTAKTGTVASDGSYALTAYPPVAGTTAYRVVMPAASGLDARAFSAKLIVKPTIESLAAVKPACYGVTAAATGCRNPQLAGLLLPANTGTVLTDDSGGGFSCWTKNQDGPVPVCADGKVTGTTRIALVGDSHAAALLPGLRAGALAKNVRIDTYTGRFCRWGDDGERGLKDQYGRPLNCSSRTKQITDALIKNKYDVVLYVTLKVRNDTDELVAGDTDRLAGVFSKVAARGTTVVALRDYPYLADKKIDCLRVNAMPKRLDCSEEESKVMPDPAKDAANLAVQKIASDPVYSSTVKSHVKFLDANATDKLYCREERCPFVTGAMAVFRDGHHLTGTYSTSIGPKLLQRVLDQR